MERYKVYVIVRIESYCTGHGEYSSVCNLLSNEIFCSKEEAENFRNLHRIGGVINELYLNIKEEN